MIARARPQSDYFRRRAELRAAVAREVLAGASVAEAAARHGVDQTTAYRACREHGLAFGRAGDTGRVAGAVRRGREIAEAVRGGEGVADVARRLGVSEVTARAACRRHGVDAPRAGGPRRAEALRARAELAAAPLPEVKPLRSRWPNSAKKMAEVARLLATTDLTYAQIGARCGVSRQRVGQVMRLLGGA